MRDAKQERLVRWMEQHNVSARCGAHIVGTLLRARWLSPLPNAARFTAIEWHALNPPLDPSFHDFPTTCEES